MNVLKMFVWFARNLKLKNCSQITLSGPSEKRWIHFMKRIFWVMMILQDFLKMEIISSRPNWNLARIRFIRNAIINLMDLILNVLSVQRNAKSLSIQSILEANVQLMSILLNSTCTVKNQGMKILDTPINPDHSMLPLRRRKQADKWRTLLNCWRRWQWSWRILAW